MAKQPAFGEFAKEVLGLPPGQPVQDLVDKFIAERNIQIQQSGTGIKRIPQMGFFDLLISGGKALLRAVTGGGFLAPRAAAQTVAPAVRAAPALAAARRGAVVAGGVGVATGLGLSTLGGGADGDPAMIGGGNGRTVRQTIVITRDTATGEIIRQVVLQGAPFLMGRDVQIANRVFRQSTRLQKRLPKRLVRQTRRSALTQQVVEQALERAACPQPIVKGC